MTIVSSPVGKVLGGRYVLGALLGTGGMADVYRAEDRVLERSVAVKVMRGTAGETERARFAGEARTLASLNHPGLVTVLDAGTEDEHPYLVMELVDGPTLAETIRSAGPMHPARVAQIGAQLAGALAYAHTSGVVHRDVKPSNILLRADGSAVLTDFGIARLLAAPEQHTRIGETIGSPAYLSPEQVTGEPPTAAVDVYSLGLVLIEALTGARVYSGPPVEAAVARLTTPPAIPESLDPVWHELLVDLTQLDPASRPGAADVAERLTARSADVPTSVYEFPSSTAVLTSVPAPAIAPPPRRRWRVALAAAALATAAALAVGGMSLIGPDDVPADGTPQQPASPPGVTPGASPSTPDVPVVTKAKAKPPKPVKHRDGPPGQAKKHGKGKDKHHR